MSIRFSIEGFFCGPRATVECVLIEMAQMEGAQRGEVDAPFDFKDEKWLALGEAEAAFGENGQGELYQRLVKLESRLPKNRQHFIGVKTAEEFYEKCLAYAKGKIGPEHIAELVKKVAADAATLRHPTGAREKNDEVFERFASLCKILAPFEPQKIEQAITSLFLMGLSPVSSDYSMIAYNLYEDTGFEKDFSFYNQVIIKGINSTVIDQAMRDFLKSDLDADQKRELLYTALQNRSKGIQYYAAEELVKIGDAKALRVLHDMFWDPDFSIMQKEKALAAIGKVWSLPIELDQHQSNIHFVLRVLIEVEDSVLRRKARELLVAHKDGIVEEIVRLAFADYMKINSTHASTMKSILEEIGDEETREFIAEVTNAFSPKGFKDTGFQSGFGVGASILARGPDDVPQFHFYAEVTPLEVTYVFLRANRSRDENWMVRQAIDGRFGTDHDDGIGQVARLRSGVLTEFGGIDVSYGVNHRGQPYLGLHVNFVDWRRMIIPGVGVFLEAVLPTGRDGADDPFVITGGLAARWAWPWSWNINN